jgi:hypothetical protein
MNAITPQMATACAARTSFDLIGVLVFAAWRE